MSLQLSDLKHIVEPYSRCEEITALAIAGSFATGVADEESDIDLYLYSDAGLSLDERREIAESIGRDIEFNQQYWETTDAWTDPVTKRRVEVTYRSPSWIVQQIRQVLVNPQPRLGYTTCIWDNLLHSVPVYDPQGWYADLRKAALVPYPNELREAIVRHNHPVLRSITTSYLHQIQLAVKRQDPMSLNHRVSSLLASYFDILFAVNRSPNPGEKRIILHARKRCKRFPADWEEDITRVLSAACGLNGEIEESINRLLDRMDEFLKGEGLL